MDTFIVSYVIDTFSAGSNVRFDENPNQTEVMNAKDIKGIYEQLYRRYGETGLIGVYNVKRMN